MLQISAAAVKAAFFLGGGEFVAGVNSSSLTTCNVGVVLWTDCVG